jgi:hypothetical protein
VSGFATIWKCLIKPCTEISYSPTVFCLLMQIDFPYWPVEQRQAGYAWNAASQLNMSPVYPLIIYLIISIHLGPSWPLAGQSRQNPSHPYGQPNHAISVTTSNRPFDPAEMIWCPQQQVPIFAAPVLSFAAQMTSAAPPQATYIDLSSGAETNFCALLNRASTSPVREERLSRSGGGVGKVLNSRRGRKTFARL